VVAEGGVLMSDPIHGDGVFQCNGCGRLYHEYVNGCVEEHDAPRSVKLTVPDGVQTLHHRARDRRRYRASVLKGEGEE
jgi:hypothetical protein